jgi:hypothetical protein
MKGKLTGTSNRERVLKLPTRLKASVQKKNSPYEEAAVGDKVWVIKGKAFAVLMEKLSHGTFRLKSAAGERNLPADQVSLLLSGSGRSGEIATNIRLGAITMLLGLPLSFLSLLLMGSKMIVAVVAMCMATVVLAMFFLLVAVEGMWWLRWRRMSMVIDSKSHMERITIKCIL